MFLKKSLEDRVEKAKSDETELNNLISEYKPFIASTIQKKTGRYLRYGLDDELSIGMMAFKEAIDSYNRDRGKFLSFAKQVINLRMIDYYRKNKDKNIVYLESIKDDEEEDGLEYTTTKAVEEYQVNQENEIRRLEIFEYREELKMWGISFDDLVSNSPKQEKVRNIYKEAALTIVKNRDLYEKLADSKRLPIKELEKCMNIHRKKLERGRIYIISLVIIMEGQYEYLREYMRWR